MIPALSCFTGEQRSLALVPVIAASTRINSAVVPSSSRLDDTVGKPLSEREPAGKSVFPVSSLYDGAKVASYKRFIRNHATASNRQAANSCRFSNATANKTKGTASVPEESAARAVLDIEIRCTVVSAI
jgi:hypothetical protein